MTVSSTTSKVSYSGNGSTTTFTVPYYFLANTHLSVILRSVSGVETTKALTADYTVSGAGSPSGGSITMIVAPATGETLVILRSVPYTQDIDYVTNDPFPANTHEMALDKLTMEIQQLAEASGRALTLSPTTSGVLTTLPAPSSNKIIGWDTTATVLQNYDPSSLLTAVGSSGFSTQLFSGNGSQTAFTLSQAPGIIANLDVFISGVRQRPTIDYTLLSNTLTFLTAPATGTNNIFCKWGQTFGIGVVADGGVKTSSFDPTAVAPSAINVAGTGVVGTTQLAAASVTQAKLGTNVAGNGPAFSAYQSSPQGIADSTPTKVLFQTEEFDTNSAFSSSRFQPTVAGYYLFTASVGTTTATTLSAVYFYKGTDPGVPSLFKVGASMAHPANNITISGSSIILLNGSTDYVEAWTFQQGTTPTLTADAAVTFFQGSLLRAA